VAGANGVLNEPRPSAPASGGPSPDLTAPPSAIDSAPTLDEPTLAPPTFGQFERDAQHLNLSSVPAGHVTKIGQAEAVAIARERIRSTTDPMVVEHGVGEIDATTGSPVWLIVFPAIDASPVPAGPICPSAGEQCAGFLMTSHGVLISDQTGDVVQEFSSGLEVHWPPQ
jgi:hypothetical protein